MFAFKHPYPLLLTACMIFCTTSDAQVPGRPSQSYYVEHYGEEEGLPQNSINGILQDKNDFLWIATEAGVTRFNGNRFLKVPFRSKTSHDNFNRIKNFYFKGRDTILALSTANPYVAMIVNNKIIAVEKLDYNKHGLLFLNMTIPVPMPVFSKDSASSSYRSFSEWDAENGGHYGSLSGNDSFVVLMRSGMGVYNSKGLIRRIPVKIAQEHTGRIVFIAGKLYYLEETNQLSIYSASGLLRQTSVAHLGKRVRIFSAGNANGFFAVADSVLYRVNINAMQLLHFEKILTNLQQAADISIVFQKDSNTIVTGTRRHGLYLYKKQYFRVSEPLGGEELDAFYGQLLMKDGKTILAGRNKLFRDGHYVGKTRDVFTTSTYSGLTDSKGFHWYIYYDKVFRSSEIGLPPDTMGYFRNTPVLALEDRQQRIWVHSQQEFGFFENDRFITIQLNNLKPGSITCMAQDKNGGYLVGTREGLFFLKGINEKRLEEIPGLRSRDIRYILCQPDGRTWICTYGNGLYLLNKAEVTAFPNRDGQLAYVHSVIEDAKGNFWMPTNNGLFVTAKRALIAYTANKNELPFYYQFSRRHGLRTNEFNGGGVPPFLQWANGDISLPSMQGLVLFNPALINFYFSSAPILVDHIQLDSTETLQQTGFDISNKISNISFTVSSSFWGNAENALLEYLVMEQGKSPGKSGWLPVDASGKINLFTPSHGNYKLIIRKRIGLAPEDYVYKEVGFRVLPKWYQTKAFYLLALIGLVLLIAGVSFWRRGYYRKANRILQDKVNAATVSLLQMNNTLEKKVEERTHAIKEAEIKFRTLVEGSLVGVYIVQEERLLYVNPRFEQILGYDRGELPPGTSVQVLVPEDQRELTDEQIRLRMTGEQESVRYELKALKKNGSNADLEIFGRYTIYEGKPTIIGTLLDITERKQMETELREAELKFRDLVEKSMVGVYIIQDGKFAYVNPRLAEMFGYEPKELINTILTTQLVDPESVSFVNKSINAKIEGELESNNYEAKGLKKDGSNIWMEVYSSATLFQGKNAVIGSVLDITDRKLAKEQLIKEKDLSASIINSLPGVFYIFDQEGRYQLWNKNHENITGYNSEEMGNMHPSRFVERSKVDELNERMTRVFTQGHAELQANFIRKDGTGVPYFFNGTLIDYNEKPCIMGVGIDISERVNAEAEKEQANYMLNERIKELTTLYRVAMILQREERSMLVSLHDLVTQLPAGWQFSSIAAARVSLGEMEFVTPNFKPSAYSQSAEFITAGGTEGKIEIVYLEERPDADEGPFLSEERKMLDMIADMLQVYFTKKETVDALQKSEANLHTIFDTTDTMYVLLDVSFQVIAYNQGAVNFIKTELDHQLELRKNFIDYFPETRRGDVAANMEKVMRGEHVSYEVSYPQPDGSLHWYHVRMFPITNAAQVSFGMMVAVSDITEKKRLEQEILEQKVQEQKMVTRAVLIGEERERNKIGQELHDNVNQILAGTKLYLSMARRNKDAGENIISESMELIDSAIEEIRTLSKGKVTPMKKVDLKELLQLLVEGVGSNSGLDTRFTYRGSGGFIEDDIKLNIYRIIQEQLNNILKHAEARHVDVEVEERSGSVRVMVKDDGKGFNPGMKKKGIGISNMINRVEAFNGTIDIESSPGKGCTIRIHIPLADQDVIS